MMMQNMAYLEQLLGVPPVKKVRRRQPKIRQLPLFKVIASLSAPDIVVAPLSIEVHKMLQKYIKSLVDSAKLFHRWQRGTCIITPPQKTIEDEEPIVFSFHSDVVANPMITTMSNGLNSSIGRTFNSLAMYLDSWRRYRPLWKVDKVNNRRAEYQ
jgi:dynein heavy chain